MMKASPYLTPEYYNAIVRAFSGIAHDLAEACRAGGEKEQRIHICDAADAVYNTLQAEGSEILKKIPASNHDTSLVFAVIKRHLRDYAGGRSYIYL